MWNAQSCINKHLTLVFSQFRYVLVRRPMSFSIFLPFLFHIFASYSIFSFLAFACYRSTWRTRYLSISREASDSSISSGYIGDVREPFTSSVAHNRFAIFGKAPFNISESRISASIIIFLLYIWDRMGSRVQTQAMWWVSANGSES